MLVWSQLLLCLYIGFGILKTTISQDGVYDTKRKEIRFLMVISFMVCWVLCVSKSHTTLSDYGVFVLVGIVVWVVVVGIIVWRNVLMCM